MGHWQLGSHQAGKVVSPLDELLEVRIPRKISLCWGWIWDWGDSRDWESWDSMGMEEGFQWDWDGIGMGLGWDWVRLGLDWDEIDGMGLGLGL